MQTKRKRFTHAFTIVELMIVIVIIAILASITVIGYGGVQNQADNTVRATEMQQWNHILESYFATNGRYPDVPSANYCLGTNFPDGDSDGKGECRDYAQNYAPTTYQEEFSQPLLTALKTVGSLPSGINKQVNGSVGPYLTFWQTGYTITSVFTGGISDCPSFTTGTWTDGEGKVLCELVMDSVSTTVEANEHRRLEVTYWKQAFDTYKLTYGSYPAVPNGNYCLGFSFPDGDSDGKGECRDYQANNAATYQQENNLQLMTLLYNVTPIPIGLNRPVNGTVGPYIDYWGSGYTITAVFQDITTCPSGLYYVWGDGAGRLLCAMDVNS